MHVNIVEKGKKFLIQMNIQQQQTVHKTLYEFLLGTRSAARKRVLRRVMNLFSNYK